MADHAQSPVRSVVVTGASTGIGHACALRLDGLGLRVFAGVRREEDGRALKQQASERLVPISLDVVDPASIAAATQAVSVALGDAGLDGLVNNAGIAVAAPLEVTVTGQIAVTQAFFPLLRRARGRIVNMGSIGGRLASPFLGPYAASKFAMEALTDCLRVELRPWGMHVAIVEPAGIATPIWDKSIGEADRLLQSMPQQLFDYYGPAISGVRKFAARSGKSGMPTSVVADAVAHALTARRPKTRYPVAQNAWLITQVIARLPDRLRDTIITRQLPKYP